MRSRRRSKTFIVFKPAKGADKSVAELLGRIGQGETTGEFAVSGTIELTDYAWLMVERIEAKKYATAVFCAQHTAIDRPRPSPGESVPW